MRTTLTLGEIAAVGFVLACWVGCVLAVGGWWAP